MSEFKPSEYQKEIFDFIKHGVGNAVIDAKAGSGKTTTMVEGIKYVPKDMKAIFVAFNKSICEELEERLIGIDNVRNGNHYNENQKKAINARGEQVLISAAAGSGKTAVLTERVKNILCDTENPC